jgi:hypothetical protein
LILLLILKALVLFIIHFVKNFIAQNKTLSESKENEQMDKQTQPTYQIKLQNMYALAPNMSCCIRLEAGIETCSADVQRWSC